MKRGVQGVVIDAGIRDVARLRELGFPVWSKAIHSLGTTKSRGGWVNAPAVCGGVRIMPGDLIVADDDGVVCVAQEDLPSVLESVRNRVRKEEQTKEKIAKGEISLDFYGLRSVLERENVVYLDEIPRSDLPGKSSS
jgi:4-hydroxy-4-methyl-2-oxoglutarate aldolase